MPFVPHFRLSPRASYLLPCLFARRRRVGAAHSPSRAGAGCLARRAAARGRGPRPPPPLPSRRVWALAFDPSDPGRIFVGSHSAGVYVARRGSDAAATSK